MWREVGERFPMMDSWRYPGMAESASEENFEKGNEEVCTPKPVTKTLIDFPCAIGLFLCVSMIIIHSLVRQELGVYMCARLTHYRNRAMQILPCSA